MTHLEVRSGSHAYGFSTPESDVDIRGIKWQGNLSNLLGFSGQIENPKANQKNESKIDESFHSFKKFVGLLVAHSSFTQLDLLFTRKVDIINIDNWGQMLIDNRLKFLSKRKILECCRGFARHQYHFVQKNKPEERAKRENTLTLPEYVKQYRKAQHHSIRTLWQALVCFKDETWPVYTKDFDIDAHKMLMDIKIGAMPYQEWEDLFNSYIAKVEAAYVHSKLPEKIESAYWERTVIDYHLILVDMLKTHPY